MIQGYFTTNDKQWSDTTLAEMLGPLPQDMRNKILTYNSWKDRQSRIIGKWLLMRLIDKFGMDLALSDLIYTSHNQPNFPAGFYFSIAHSGDMVAAVASKKYSIGIDIEQINAIGLEDYDDHLTYREWAKVNASPDRVRAFYDIWTKKEALLKALGLGITIDLNKLEVTDDKIRIKSKKYFLHPVLMADNYAAHIATSAPSDSVIISFERLTNLP